MDCTTIDPTGVQRSAGRAGSARGQIRYFSSDIEHDIESAFECSRFQGIGRLEAHDHALARGLVADAVEEAVGGVLALACDVHLGGEPPGSGRVHLEMDVRRAAGIGYRADSAEAVAAVGSVRCV